MKKKFTIEKPYIHLPIAVGIPKVYVKFIIDGVELHEFHIGLSTEPDFYSTYCVKNSIGSIITLETATDCAGLDAVVQGESMIDSDLYSNLYKEPARPLFHFTSRRGWLNDPNGLVYDGSLYHLYYQHNPYGVSHGGVNIQWGHAVSPDLVHFTERDDAILPWDRFTHVASGNAIMDSENIVGKGENSIIAAFTALGSADYNKEDKSVFSSRGQYLYISTDGGDTYSPLDNNPAIPTDNGEDWRDPFIMLRDDKSYNIAVYERFNDSNCVSFYKSTDLTDFKRTARVQDLYECPNLFEMQVEGSDEKKWILFGADGMVRFGDFSDKFVQIGDVQPLDYGKNTYAGQVWSNTGDKKYHIGWVLDIHEDSWLDLGWNSDTYNGMPFNQCMTVPCQLALKKSGDKFRLARNPVSGLEKLRQEKTTIDIAESTSLLLPESADVKLNFEAGAAIKFSIGEAYISYDPENDTVTIPGKNKIHTVKIEKEAEKTVRILVDKGTVEFFMFNEISATYGFKTKNLPLMISCSDTHIKGEIYEMSSIY